jgi:hypothetical protein
MPVVNGVELTAIDADMFALARARWFDWSRGTSVFVERVLGDHHLGDPGQAVPDGAAFGDALANHRRRKLGACHLDAFDAGFGDELGPFFELAHLVLVARKDQDGDELEQLFAAGPLAHPPLVVGVEVFGAGQVEEFGIAVLFLDLFDGIEGVADATLVDADARGFEVRIVRDCGDHHFVTSLGIEDAGLVGRVAAGEEENEIETLDLTCALSANQVSVVDRAECPVVKTDFETRLA